MTPQTKEVTVKYKLGHTRTFVCEKDDSIYCPNCGNQGIWIEDSLGDYYVGVDHYCTECSFVFTMPTGSEAVSTGKQIIEQLKIK